MMSNGNGAQRTGAQQVGGGCWRWLPLGLAVVAVSGLGLGAQAPTPPGGGVPGSKIIRYRVPPGPPLKLITASDPAFDALVDGPFPGFSVLPNYEALRPYLVLVANQTNFSARAYAIAWQVTAADGSDGGSFTVTGLSTPSQVERPLTDAIPAGGYRLISPRFNLGPFEWKSRSYRPKEFAWLYPGRRLPSPSGGASVTAELDGVVWGNGRFHGPDRSHILERYYNARDAEHDEALEIRNLMNAGASPQAVLAKLKVHEERGQGDKGRGMRPMYIIARRNSALLLERYFSYADGFAALKREVDWMVQQMPPHEKPTAMGEFYAARFKSDADLGPNAAARLHQVHK